MSTFDSLTELFSEVAIAADLCLKPWKHSVLTNENTSHQDIIDNDFFELSLRIESRDSDGQRYPENDLEIEIFRSGSELNITLAWNEFPLRPILWQGKYSLWMDGSTGQRSSPPEGGEKLEAFARRIRSRFSSLY